MDILIVLYRTILFYFVIAIVYRFMGKREVGELSIMDLIVSILIAELAAMSIEQYNKSVFLSLIPMIVLVLLQIVFAKLSLKHPKLRTLLDGEPSFIIEKGKVNYKELVKQRYNLEDLLTQLRAREIKSLEEVDYAILETNGNLSIFQNTKEYPLPIILDGDIDFHVLKEINKDKKWIDDMLNKKKIKLEDVFYAFYTKDKTFIIKKSDLIK